MSVLNFLGSLLWSVASALARKFSKPESLGVRTISVGNLQAGGAGKTPLVAEVARQAHERGLVACILCRGYGGGWEARGAGGIIAPGEDCPDTIFCGDEAALLHDLAPHAWIGVGSDRRTQFARIRDRLGGKKIDLVILDDGFQNHAIHKDVQIVALTSATRWQRLFRDFQSALRHADLVVWTKGKKAPDSYGREMVQVRFRLPSPDFALKICLVTGVGDTEAVRTSVIEAGHRLERHIPFPDHARYSEPVVRSLVDQCRAEGLRVAITGKDWVKWREMKISSAGQILVLEPQVEFTERDRKIWDRVLWGV